MEFFAFFGVVAVAQVVEIGVGIEAVLCHLDLRHGHILTFQVMLRDQTGLLSAVLSVFAQCGANILTINQSIPVSGCATITISAETAGMSESMETLMNRLVAADGVIRAEILAG